MKRHGFLAAKLFLAGVVALPIGAAALPRLAMGAADNTSGMALLSAQVASNGTLTGGSGATGATGGSGTYNVFFDRDVSQCAYSGMLRSSTGSLTPSRISPYRAA